jgi:hypothetical protein
VNGRGGMGRSLRPVTLVVITGSRARPGRGPVSGDARLRPQPARRPAVAPSGLRRSARRLPGDGLGVARGGAVARGLRARFFPANRAAAGSARGAARRGAARRLPGCAHRVPAAAQATLWPCLPCPSASDIRARSVRTSLGRCRCWPGCAAMKHSRSCARAKGACRRATRALSVPPPCCRFVCFEASRPRGPHCSLLSRNANHRLGMRDSDLELRTQRPDDLVAKLPG